MQSIQKNLLKLALAIVMLSSVAFADGEMGNGGLWGNPSSPTKPVVQNSDGGQLVNGETIASSDNEIGIDWLMNSIAELLGMND